MKPEEQSGAGATGAPTGVNASPFAERRVTEIPDESTPPEDSAERPARGSSGTAPTALSGPVAREAEEAVPVPTGQNVPTKTGNTSPSPLESVTQSTTSTVDEKALAAGATAPEDVERTPPQEDVPRPAVPTAPTPDESLGQTRCDDGNTGGESTEGCGRGTSDPKTGSMRSRTPTDASTTAAPPAPSTGDARDAFTSLDEPAGHLPPRPLAAVQPEDPPDGSTEPTETTTPHRPALTIAARPDLSGPSPSPDYGAAGVLPFCILGGDLLFLLGQQHRFTSRSRSTSLSETGEHSKSKREGREAEVVTGQRGPGSPTGTDGSGGSPAFPSREGVVSAGLLWSDFGGAREDGDRDAESTASREFAEESLGLFDGVRLGRESVARSQASMEALLRDPSLRGKRVFESRNGGYVMFVAAVDFVPDIMMKLARKEIVEGRGTHVTGDGSGGSGGSSGGDVSGDGEAGAVETPSPWLTEKTDFAWVPAASLLGAMQESRHRSTRRVVVKLGGCRFLRLFHKFVISLWGLDLAAMIEAATTPLGRRKRLLPTPRALLLKPGLGRSGETSPESPRADGGARGVRPGSGSSPVPAARCAIRGIDCIRPSFLSGRKRTGLGIIDAPLPSPYRRRLSSRQRTATVGVTRVARDGDGDQGQRVSLDARGAGGMGGEGSGDGRVLQGPVTDAPDRRMEEGRARPLGRRGRGRRSGASIRKERRQRKEARRRNAAKAAAAAEKTTKTAVQPPEEP